MKADYVLLGTRIKEQRQRRMLTQQQLAEKVRLTQGFISRKEKEKKNAKRDPKSRHSPSPPASAKGGSSEISDSPNTRKNTSVVP